MAFRLGLRLPGAVTSQQSPTTGMSFSSAKSRPPIRSGPSPAKGGDRGLMCRPSARRSSHSSRRRTSRHCCRRKAFRNSPRRRLPGLKACSPISNASGYRAGHSMTRNTMQACAAWLRPCSGLKARRLPRFPSRGLPRGSRIGRSRTSAQRSGARLRASRKRWVESREAVAFRRRSVHDQYLPCHNMHLDLAGGGDEIIKSRVIPKGRVGVENPIGCMPLEAQSHQMQMAQPGLVETASTEWGKATSTIQTRILSVSSPYRADVKRR